MTEGPPIQPCITTLLREITRSVEDLSAEQTRMRPRNRPAAWSIQQILEHLILTYEGASIAFEKRLAQGRPTGRPVTIGERVMQKCVLDWGYFPNGRKAPEMVRPGVLNLEKMSGAELAQEAAKRLQDLNRLVNQATDSFGSRRSIVHAVLGPLSPGQWCSFQLVHGRHHLKQIAAIRRNYGL